MMASRGMGAVLPSKMPKGSRKARRDDTDFTQYAEGGSVEEEAQASDTKFNVQRPRLNLKQKELSGRLTTEKQLGPNTSLQAYLDAKVGSRGIGIPGAGVQLTHRFAKGGSVKDVTKSLKKAGFYGASEPKRLAIINKVTTKPQRIKMVDKMFLGKK